MRSVRCGTEGFLRRCCRARRGADPSSPPPPRPRGVRGFASWRSNEPSVPVRRPPAASHSRPISCSSSEMRQLAGTTVVCVSDDEATSASATPEATSIEGLLERATRLSTELEAAWSAALDRAILDPAQERLTAEWSAVFTELRASMERAATDAEAAGLDPRLTNYPAGLDTLDELEGDA